MASGTTREFLARDVYSRWRKRVSAAERSVVIYTPFLDRLVLSLLSATELQPTQILVITDLSPDSGARDYLAQLRALDRLLDRRVQVRSLPRLHSKVLLVDGKTVTVGSQNFTSYARKSKECTATPKDSFEGSDLLDQLLRWKEESVEVDTGLVKHLLASIDQPAKAVKVAQAALSAAFEEARADYDSKREALLAARREEALLAARREEALRLEEYRRRLFSERRLRDLQSRSRLRLAREWAYATVTGVVSSTTFEEYTSLVADREHVLTEWLAVDGSGRRGPQELARLRMTPIMIAESGRMAFARIGRTRITYVRASVAWNTIYRIGGRDVTVSVMFPAARTTERNITAKIRGRDLRSLECEIDLLFDGEVLHVVGTAGSFGDGDAERLAQFKKACRDHLADPVTQAAFFRAHLRNFKFKELGVNNHNVQDFFETGRYRLGLIQFADTPVMIASKL